MLQLAWYLGGFAAGIFLSLVEEADQDATMRCAREAQQRVDRLRAQADFETSRVYDRWAGQMGRDVRRAYETRLGR